MKEHNKLLCTLAVFGTVALLVWGTVGYIVVHFVSKYW